MDLRTLTDRSEVMFTQLTPSTFGPMVTMGMRWETLSSRRRTSSALPDSTGTPTSTAPHTGSSRMSPAMVSSPRRDTSGWYTTSGQPAWRAACSAPAHSIE